MILGHRLCVSSPAAVQLNASTRQPAFSQIGLCVPSIRAWHSLSRVRWKWPQLAQSTGCTRCMLPRRTAVRNKQPSEHSQLSRLSQPGSRCSTERFRRQRARRSQLSVAATASGGSPSDDLTQQDRDSYERNQQEVFEQMNRSIEEKHQERLNRQRAGVPPSQPIGNTGPSLAYRWYSKVEINGLRRDTVRDACEARGLSTEGSLPVLKKRLAESVEQDPLPHMIDIRSTLDTMSRADMEAELQARGITPIGAKSELKEVLQRVLSTEYPNDPNAQPLSPIEDDDLAPIEDEDDGVPQHFKDMRIRDLQGELAKRGVRKPNNARKEVLIRLLMTSIEQEAEQQAQAEKAEAMEAAQQQVVQRQQEQQRVWQQTRELLHGGSAPPDWGLEDSVTAPDPAQAQHPQPDDAYRGLQWGDGRVDSPDAAYDVTPPRQTIFLEDIYSDGYDELFDVNLNELEDDKIIAELQQRQVQPADSREEIVQQLGDVLREELVAILSDEEVEEELRQRGVDAIDMDPREVLLDDMVGDAGRDVERDAADFVDKLSNEEVLLEAQVRQVDVPRGSDGREELRMAVERQLEHNYGNVNTLYIYAEQMEEYAKEQQELRAWADAHPDYAGDEIDEDPSDLQISPDPPLTVALIVGGPGSDAARFDAFQAAAGLAQHLRTAPMDEDDDEDEPSGAEGDERSGSTGVRPPYGLLMDMWRSQQPEGADVAEDKAQLPSYLTSGGIAVNAYYIDGKGTSWWMPLSTLLASTPEELDCKLTALSVEPLHSLKALAEEIRSCSDIAWPVVHGAWGESGMLQRALSEAGVPFVGSDETVSSAATNKLRLNDVLIEKGYPAIPRLPLPVSLLESKQTFGDWVERVMEPWLQMQDLNAETSRMYVKPAKGCNRDGVSSARGVEGVLEAAMGLYKDGSFGEELVVEPQVAPICGNNEAGGMPFSVHVISTSRGPMALPPTEIASYDIEHDIRASYLALHRETYLKQGLQPEMVELMLEALRLEVSGQEDHELAMVSDPLRVSLPDQQLRLHTPTRLPLAVTRQLRLAAARLFTDLGLRDHARLDGWVVLPMSFQGMEDMLPTAEDAQAVAAGAQIDVEGTQREFERQAAIRKAKAGMVDEDGLPITAAASLEAAKMADKRDAEAAVASEAELKKRRAAFERALRETDVGPEVEFDVPADFVEAEGGVERFVDVMYGTSLLTGDGPEDASFFSHLTQPDQAVALEDSPELDNEDEEWDSIDPLWLQDPLMWAPKELCRTAEGTIVFTDVNLRADTAPDSLLFHQAAAVGMTHSSMLRHLVSLPAQRAGLPTVHAHSDLKPTLPVRYHPEEVEPAEPENILLEEVPQSSDAPILPPLMSDSEWQQKEQAADEYLALLTESRQPYDRQRPATAHNGSSPSRGNGTGAGDGSKSGNGTGAKLGNGTGNGNGADSSSGHMQDLIARLPPSAQDRLTGLSPAQQAAVIRDVLGIRFDKDNGNGSGSGNGAAADPSSDVPDDAAINEMLMDQQTQQPGQAAQDPEDSTEQVTSQIWVLMGGEGSGRHKALSAGRAAFLACAGPSGGDAKPVLLAPWAAGLKENERRKELLRKRNKYLNLGLPEADLAPQEQLDYIRQPFEEEQEPFLMKQGTWVLPYSGPLSTSCEAIVEGSEAALSLANTSLVAASRSDLGKGHIWEDARAEAQRELAIAGVSGVGALFGGLEQRPTPPQYLDMAALLERAVAERAVLWLAISENDYGCTGLQENLEEMRIPFTGPSAISAKMCSNRTEFAKQLATEANYKGGITTPPQHELQTEALVAALEDPEELEALWHKVVDAVGANRGSQGRLGIRPAQNCGDEGVATLTSAEDLAWYGNAIAECWVRMPFGTLELQTTPINMPFPIADTLVLEPYINPFSVVLHDSADGGPPQLTWVEDAHWARVTWCLLGQLGDMMPLPPTLHVTRAAADGMLLEGQETLRYTPVPETLVSEAALTEAGQRVKRVSQQLALRGAVVIHTFVQAESGDIVVVDVTPGADLTPGSVFLSQGLAHDPPLDAARLARFVAAEAVAACAELPKQSLEEVDPQGFYSQMYIEGDADEESASDPLFGRKKRGRGRGNDFVKDPTFGVGSGDPFFDTGSSSSTGWGGQTGLTRDDWQLKGEYTDREPTTVSPRGNTEPFDDPYLSDDPF